jgi:hypothetical protein
MEVDRKHASDDAVFFRASHCMPVVRRTAAFAVALAIGLALSAAPAAAQSATGRSTELGVDAGVTFGLGDQSSIDFSLPGSRFRLGFFQPGSRISIEPAAGLGYHKVEGVDGVFQYDLQLALLYHFTPIAVSTGGTTPLVTGPYLRPFLGLTGYSGGGNSDNEFSAGVGLGVMVPWRTELAWRLEANLGRGFSNHATRLGLLAGLSYFPR